MAELAPKEGAIQVEILIENQERFNLALARAKQVIGDLTLPLTQIGLMMFKSQRAIFDLKGPGLYPDFKSKNYRKQKLKRWGFLYPLLKASGRLESSTTDPSSPDAVMRIENNNTLYWGTRVPYGIFHQSKEPRTKIPYRPFLIWAADSRYAPDLASSRIGRALNILNYHTLRALGEDIGPTGGE